MRPNFFVVGAHKAGTTSFCALLHAHPDVFVSSPKEPNYFARPQGMDGRAEWYEGLFAAARDTWAVGEGSTLYSQCGVFPGTADRISAYSPAARIFYLVRHPLRRIESAWMQYRSAGRADVPADFARAVREVPQLLDASLYLRQLAQYRQRFRNVAVLFFEDFVNDPAAAVRDAYSFLGVAETFEPEDVRRPRNPSAGKREPRRLLEERWYRVMKRMSTRRVVSPLTKSIVKKLVTRKIDRPVFDISTKAWVRDQLEDETGLFLQDEGKPTTYWTFD